VVARPVRSRRPGAVALGAALACWLAARAARADEAGAPGGSIGARGASCPDAPWSDEAWIALLRVELAADGVHVTPDGSGGKERGEVALVRASCDEPAASATVTFTRGDVHRSRVVPLADVPAGARARVLAIASADLVRESLAAPSEDASPSPATSSPPAHVEVDLHVHLARPDPAGEPSAPEVPRWTVAFSGEGRSFTSRGTGLFGARLGGRVVLLSWLAAGIDGGVLSGQAHDVLGDIDGLLASAGVSLLATGGTPAVRFGVGPRLEGGLASFRGRASLPSTRASSVRGGVALLGLTAFVSFRVSGALGGEVALDAGSTLESFGARADDRQPETFGGPVLGVRIGLAWNAPGRRPPP